MTLVLDATVLLNFGRVAALSVVERTSTVPLIVLDAVVAEVRHPPIAVDQLREALANARMRQHTLTTEAENRWLTELRQHTPSLGIGEAASLAACMANGWAFATDDGRARRLVASRSIGPAIRLTGTLGILVEAVTRAIIDRSGAEDLLAQMIVAGYRSPVNHLADLIDLTSP